MDILDLPWLLPAPDDFRARVKHLRRSPTADRAEIMQLAEYALDPSRLEQVGKLIEVAKDDLRAAGGLQPVTLGIVGTHTTQLLAGALPATGLRHNLLLETVSSDYGQAAQQLLDPQGKVATARPDFVLLALDAVALGLARPILDQDAAEETIGSAIEFVRSLRDAAHANTGAGVILQTLPQPGEDLFGNFDRRGAGSRRALVDRFNARLAAECVGDGDLLLDLGAVAEQVGLSRWHDPMRWHDAKLPFALDAIPLVADHVCRLLAAARGRTRKCLVLDLDNTLWGGVVGDDGVEGIRLGQGSAAGEAHLALQAFALDLRQRGIILAVCSKNEEAAARAPFREHGEMLLREDHISVFVANWTDKATNLQAIAEALNISADSLVFLDDNPAERERVRQELPQVAVPEVGNEPSDYLRLLAWAGYFEAISFGEEDRQRADMYQANARRATALQKIGNLDEYLQSLEMTCSIVPFDDIGRARIAQLINKSNQFNLTTRRYTEPQVAAMQSDPDLFTMQVRLVDRFGDNGMISVVVFERGEHEWRCDTWLMSCRVLGRRVEQAVLAHVAKAARAAGATRLIGTYLPTPKNVIVADHFASLGFAFAGDLAGGGSRWSLDLEDWRQPDLPMVVIAPGDVNRTATQRHDHAESPS